MKIVILKAHQSNGEWSHPGSTTDVDETRAKELIRNGLAAEAVTGEVKQKPAPSNKAAPAPKNKLPC